MGSDDDLVARLRELGTRYPSEAYAGFDVEERFIPNPICAEAADRIEALQHERMDALKAFRARERAQAFREAAAEIDCGGAGICRVERLKDGTCIEAATSGLCPHEAANAIRALADRAEKEAANA